ncbi:glutathione S-transferase family protein [Qipengyuania qiaonensis]|uniref:Glutathione S-transferase family protein n=1 Tax=Qipengyuania qiaonensis TaxID=2867240 RepID=A0ABS7J8I8_9SPHN|nr:glutathione S-transferase family protein [Qipengyuania qiaonensis]MBX7481963.1 glutathione S-transferase family protein [Qipengyuania qiaonensis]
MKLYEFDWALFPRRVGIYLAEKGIDGIERVALDALDPGAGSRIAGLSLQGTVPALEIEDGTVIGSSIAVLEYLEERFPSPDMIGATPQARARTREFVSVIDEAANQLGIWCHKGSPMFANQEEQSPKAATFAADAYHGRLHLLDRMMAAAGGPFVAGSQITIADCIAMATLQFADEFYGVPVPQNCRTLAAWRSHFAARPSAASPAYPQQLLEIAYGLPTHCPPTSS